MIDEKELLSMKILHYFIMKQDYNPIIIKGIKDEMWIENKDNSFSLIRIVTKHIHNKEQFDYDMLKTKHIAKQIKRKTFDFSMNVLSIYIDNEYDGDLNEDKKYVNVSICDEDDFKENEYIKKSFKNIKRDFKYDKDNFELIAQITNDIGNKNLKETEKREKLMENKKPIVTYALLAVNVIIFVLMYILGKGSQDSQTLINFGANFVQYTKSGDFYRLLTCAFLHIGVFHLLLNMYSLSVVGTQIEYFYGKVKYVFIYLFSAIMASLFTVALSANNTLAAGASGAIFGLLGAMLYFGYHYRGYIGNALLYQILPVIAINLYIGFSMPNIDNAAHIGGLIGGYLMSMALGFDKDSKSTKINGMIISIILTAFMIYLGFIR